MSITGYVQKFVVAVSELKKAMQPESDCKLYEYVCPFCAYLSLLYVWNRTSILLCTSVQYKLEAHKALCIKSPIIGHAHRIKL